MWSNKFMLVALGSHVLTVSSLSLDARSDNSVKNAAKAIAAGLTSNYTSAPKIQEWWQDSLMYNALIDYWALTGDDQFNTITKQGILGQVGNDNDFMPAAQSLYETNSEQASWAMAAMNAAEAGLDSSNNNSSWIKLVENVFGEQAARWDTDVCSGGLKDDIEPLETDYRTKGAFSNGLFMQLAARLARYTGNSSYNEWPEKVWKWSESVGLLDSNYSVYDIVDISDDCKVASKLMFTANFGPYLSTAAIQYNSTSGSSVWKSRLDGVLSRASSLFFYNNTDIMFEAVCETTQTCNEDMTSYKTVLARALGDVATFAPYQETIVTPKIQGSATAAAKQCSGTSDKDTFCNFSWLSSQADDEFTNLGSQISALQIVLANLDRPQLASANQTSPGDASGTTGPSSTSTGAPSSTQSTTATPTTGVGNRVVGSMCGVLAGVVAAMLFSL
ncbi:Putative mannan endo-1,6-alpha-mannosidase C970,02 [Talaromyces islandicus]|uniref:Mannan endo-1,6-alpha-mannosidase n=1 Tax=Talaromyces islandicus TaxID=28573 RepID=A0A0U1LNX0_TALIS|nr:Putative mannan endo-1,6-alpha-mannosidase C970,02 [Talaromyces islandicus]